MRSVSLKESRVCVRRRAVSESFSKQEDGRPAALLGCRRASARVFEVNTLERTRRLNIERRGSRLTEEPARGNENSVSSPLAGYSKGFSRGACSRERTGAAPRRRTLFPGHAAARRSTFFPGELRVPRSASERRNMYRVGRHRGLQTLPFDEVSS